MFRHIVFALFITAAAGLFGASVGYLFGTDWRINAGLAAVLVAFFMARDVWFWRNF